MSTLKVKDLNVLLRRYHKGSRSLCSKGWTRRSIFFNSKASIEVTIINEVSIRNKNNDEIEDQDLKIINELIKKRAITWRDFSYTATDFLLIELDGIINGYATFYTHVFLKPPLPKNKLHLISYLKMITKMTSENILHLFPKAIEILKNLKYDKYEKFLNQVLFTAISNAALDTAMVLLNLAVFTAKIINMPHEAFGYSLLHLAIAKGRNYKKRSRGYQMGDVIDELLKREQIDLYIIDHCGFKTIDLALLVCDVKTMNLILIKEPVLSNETILKNNIKLEYEEVINFLNGYTTSFDPSKVSFHGLPQKPFDFEHGTYDPFTGYYQTFSILNRIGWREKRKLMHKQVQNIQKKQKKQEKYPLFSHKLSM